ncbi:MAG: RuBisCO accumulation factor 1, partial [Pseudanabaenaceae cyanobacterium]
MDAETQALLQTLRRKDGGWVDWGRACRQLQQQRLSPQTVFEETGIEPTYQNQLAVAFGVWESLQAAPPEVLAYFAADGSEALYELRVLPQGDRLAAAALLARLQWDAAAAKELAKASKEASLLGQLPAGFTATPGDALAYQVWKSAQNLADPGQRARAIAKGMACASSETARQKLAQLLTETVTPTPRRAVPLPFYRLTVEDSWPCWLPVVGALPLATLPALAVTPPNPSPFGCRELTGTWVALPGWSALQKLTQGMAVLANTQTLEAATQQTLPNSFPDRPEEILLVLTAEGLAFDPQTYFAVPTDAGLTFQTFGDADTWQAAAPVARLVLVLRQPRILDETFAQE